MNNHMPKDNEVDEKVIEPVAVIYPDTGLRNDAAAMALWRNHGYDTGGEPLYSAAAVAELRAEVAYYKENFQSCMTILNAINDAITEADEDGRGFVPVNQLENILTGADPT